MIIACKDLICDLMLIEGSDREEFKLEINKIKVLPSEAEVDEPGEGDWYVVYDENDEDEKHYGYYRFSTSLAKCATEGMANLFKESLIKLIQKET